MPKPMHTFHKAGGRKCYVSAEAVVALSGGGTLDTPSTYLHLAGGSTLEVRGTVEGIYERLFQPTPPLPGEAAPAQPA